MEINVTCQSPEAVAKGLKTCKRIAGNYAIGYTGNIFVMIGAGAQLVGVCSWFPKPFGVGKEEHANTKVLCAGCNTHWIAGLVVMIWSISWFLRLNIVLAYAIAGGFVTPCLIGPVVGCMGVSNRHSASCLPLPESLTSLPFFVRFSFLPFAPRRPAQARCRKVWLKAPFRLTPPWSKVLP